MQKKINIQNFFKIPLSWWILVPLIGIRPIALLIENLLDVFSIYFATYYPQDENDLSLIVNAFQDYGESPLSWLWLVITAIVSFIFLVAYEWLVVYKTMNNSTSIEEVKNKKKYLPNTLTDFKRLVILMFKYILFFIVNVFVFCFFLFLFAMPVLLVSVFYLVPYIKPLVIFIQVSSGLVIIAAFMVSIILYTQAASYYFFKTWQIRSFLRFPTLYGLIRRQFKPLLIIGGVHFLLSQVYLVAGRLVVELLPISLWTFIGSIFYIYLLVLLASIRGKCFFWLDKKETLAVSKK